MDHDLDFKTTMEFAYGEPHGMLPGVVRVVANNPGPMTFKGTNTFLVGSEELAVIDPGPDDPAHIDAIINAAAGRTISHIFITHAHRDHVDGVNSLSERTGAITCGYGRDAETGHAAMRMTPTAKNFINHDFEPQKKLSHGDIVEGADWQLETIYTPGHAPDHICLSLRDRGVLFSGDHVMAWNTTVVAPPEGNMSDYIASLEVLSKRTDDVYLPAHGGRLEAPQRTVKAYLLHRRWREQAILAAVRQRNMTVREMLDLIYGDIEDTVRNAAALSIQAHVERLMEKGLVASAGPPGLDTVLSAN